MHSVYAALSTVSSGRPPGYTGRDQPPLTRSWSPFRASSQRAGSPRPRCGLALDSGVLDQPVFADNLGLTVVPGLLAVQVYLHAQRVLDTELLGEAVDRLAGTFSGSGRNMPRHRTVTG